LDSIAKPHKVFGFAPLADSIPKDKSGLFVLPLLYYTPDTRWAAGAAGVYYFKVKPKLPTDDLPRVSYLQFLADYTQNRQLDTWATWQVFTRNENFLLKGDVRYRDFPNRFYGIGNATEKTQEEKYSYNLCTGFGKRDRHPRQHH
jgi:hypothetical protein